MHTFWQRVNAIFFYALSVLGFLALLCAGTTYFHTAHPDVQLGLDRASLRKIMGAGHEQATLRLSIDADLSTVFNWNVKQLFVFITAEYVTKQNKLNQVVVWDHIVTGKEYARIHSSSIVNKYSLTDQGYGLRGNDITLVLHWNTIPITGLLTTTGFRQSVHTFTLEDQYS
ncbi:hypothetical protein KFE25_000734 [Diacronema lutheri]|uniref:Signal peptidase complex subunit 3 n=1 Tax=Diacronema lutheri TaxID=2081491 RepID=A0A7R9UPK7_DIALT|nr:hypothetical protein KFE25_000734 [Diacronema lutheri]